MKNSTKNSLEGWANIILGKRSENTQRCKECGDKVEHCGELNNVGQCSECALICDVCQVSSNKEPITDGLCSKCHKEVM
jgi:hypothetical protein